jgi:hypothetical protein
MKLFQSFYRKAEKETKFPREEMFQSNLDYEEILGPHKLQFTRKRDNGLKHGIVRDSFQGVINECSFKNNCKHGLRICYDVEQIVVKFFIDDVLKAGFTFDPDRSVEIGSNGERDKYLSKLSPEYFCKR